MPLPNDGVWWRINDLLFVIEFKFIQLRQQVSVPVPPELHIVLGGFGPLIVLRKSFAYDLAGGQQIAANLKHVRVERRCQDELPCWFDPLSRKVHERRLKQTTSDVVILFGLEQPKACLEAQISVDIFEDAGCR